MRTDLRPENLLIIEESHGHPSHHDSSGPLHVQLFSGPDNLEWTILRHTSHFAKLVLVYRIVRLTTLQ
jgi:hypothetical protein